MNHQAALPPRTRRCVCCGEWWVPLPEDNAAICLRCDREHTKQEIKPSTVPTRDNPLAPLFQLL